jgi:hypothetical protein
MPKRDREKRESIMSDAVLAATVILTDYQQAVLFTTWMERDIHNEMNEHFPDGDCTMYLCPRFSSDRILAEWPCEPFRQHVVPFRTVAHIIERIREEIENEQPIDGRTGDIGIPETASGDCARAKVGRRGRGEAMGCGNAERKKETIRRVGAAHR